MPKRKFHNLVNKILLGNEYVEVNRIMDYPSKFLGKRHRMLFHDPKTALALGLIKRDYKAGMACLVHQGIDRLWSRIKRKY